MLFPVHFFEINQTQPGLFDVLFGGLFLVKGLPVFFQMTYLVVMGLILLFSFQEMSLGKKSNHALLAIFSFISLVLSTFILYQPWDELFISLRHSLHLSEVGNFSFNRNERIEGIVDFLPFFVLGLLAKLGLPLLETHFVLVTLGTWLCILTARRILINLKTPYAESWSYPALLLYPPLILNTANGFIVPLFTAMLLLGTNFLFLENRRRLGWVLLSIVPLVRLEGAWFCFVTFFFFYFFKPSQKRLTLPILTEFFILMAPTLLLSFWRYHYFGSFLPVPILYKSAIGNVFYLLLGVRNLFMDFIAGGGLIWCWIIFNTKDSQKTFLSKWLALLLIFCLPYYLSGGDWFPPAWQRYLFPFSFLLYLSALNLFPSYINQNKLRPVSSLIPLTLLVLSLFVFSWGSYNRFGESLFSHKTSLSGVRQRRLGKNNYRLNYLSRLGGHLEKSTTSDTVIASSELATIMFFSKREALDLLGVTNLEIAQSPIRSAPHLFSKATNKNELPFLIFKRLKPELLYERKPGIFYAFDFILPDLIEEVPIEEVTSLDLKKAIRRWDKRFEMLNKSLFGGTDYLLNHSYEPVLIRYGEDFYSLYFVSSEFKNKHFQMMESLGMKHSMIYE